MVVIGIDFGNESCVVSTLQNKMLESIKNDYTNRRTPSIVAFVGNKRLIGVGAKNQQASNLKNTLFDLKVQLLEHKAHRYASQFTSSVYVQYNNESKIFSLVQIVAMLFSKLKADANAALLHKDVVTSCVIAVPSYFTSKERNSLLLAAGIAGLECEFLIKETTAVAINYGFYKKFTSTSNVVFIDFGHSSIQICACAFSDKRFEILAEASELIGGRDFDEQLTKHVIQELSKCKIEKRNQNFVQETSEEVKKLKEKMSSNTGKLPLNIQHLPGFETTTLTIERSEMETICKSFFDKVKDLMSRFLTDSKLKPEEIQSIELIGGSSRIPAFKKLVQDVFEKAPLVTMNQDEAVSRGCFYRSIMSKKMKDFIVIEKPVAEEQTVEGFLKVGEVHKCFKGDKNHNFFMEKHDFEKLVKDEVRMSTADMNEKARCDAKNILVEFVTLERKHGGMLEVIDDEMLRKVEFVKSWDNGTTEEYSDCLDELTQQVNEIRNLKRSAARNKLHDFLRSHEKPGGVLAQIHDQEKKKEFEHDKNWNSGSISEYGDKYETWTVYVQNESLRRNAFSDLCKFINATLKEREILKEDEEKLRKQLRETKSLPQTTTDEYKSILLELKETVKESKELCRNHARKSLIDCIEAEIETDEMLPETKNMLQNELEAMESWVGGSATAYKEKQTETSDAVKKSRNEIREKARNDVIRFIESALAEGETLEHSKLELKKTIKQVKMWNNKTLTQYNEKLQEVEKALEKANEEFRCDRREKLSKFIEDSSETLKSLNDTKLVGELAHIHSSSDEDAAYYESKLEELKKIVLAENERVKAHLKLVEFVNLNITLSTFRDSIESDLPTGLLKIEDWKSGTLRDYESAHEKLKTIVHNENQRIEALNKLLYFIKEERKAGGSMETIEDLALEDELKKIDAWISGTKEQYKEKLIIVTQFAKNEKERREARTKLQKFINRERHPNGNLFTVSDEQRNRLTWLESWHNGSKKDYIDELTNWSQYVQSEQEVKRIESYETLCQYVERHPQLVEKVSKAEIRYKLRNIQAWKLESRKDYSALLQEIKSHETEETRCSDARKRLLSFIKEERKPGGKLHIIYDKILEKRISEMSKWKRYKSQDYVAQYDELHKFFDLDNTTLLFDFDSIKKWKKTIESCINKNENVKLRDIMEKVLSFFTTRVPCCHITDLERTEIEQQMDKTVNSIDLAVNGRLYGLNHYNVYTETADNVHLILVRLVEKIVLRGE